MKPTLLVPGRYYACDGRLMVFVRRDRQSTVAPAVNWFQCEAYRGLNGPADDGKCSMNDARVVRHVGPVGSAEKGGGR